MNSIKQISYPSSIPDKKFERYWRSLPEEIRKKLNKDDLRMAYLEGFDDATVYLCNAKKVEIEINVL